MSKEPLSMANKFYLACYIALIGLLLCLGAYLAFLVLKWLASHPAGLVLAFFAGVAYVVWAKAAKEAAPAQRVLRTLQYDTALQSAHAFINRAFYLKRLEADLEEAAGEKEAAPLWQRGKPIPWGKILLATLLLSCLITIASAISAGTDLLFLSLSGLDEPIDGIWYYHLPWELGAFALALWAFSRIGVQAKSTGSILLLWGLTAIVVGVAACIFVDCKGVDPVSALGSLYRGRRYEVIHELTPYEKDLVRRELLKADPDARLTPQAAKRLSRRELIKLDPMDYVLSIPVPEFRSFRQLVLYSRRECGFSDEGWRELGWLPNEYPRGFMTWQAGLVYGYIPMRISELGGPDIYVEAAGRPVISHKQYYDLAEQDLLIDVDRAAYASSPESIGEAIGYSLSIGPAVLGECLFKAIYIWFVPLLLLQLAAYAFWRKLVWWS